MADINNPHDNYFKSVMKNPEVAKAFFNQHLPREYKEVVDLSTLRLEPTSYVSQDLTARHSDMVFQVQMDGCSGYIYLLVEHQSKPDRLLPFRLQEYTFSLMRDHLKRQQCQELPVVIPMVFYNGEKPYHMSSDLFSLFGDQCDLAKDTLFKPFHLIDLNVIHDDELRKETWTSLMSLLMKHARSKEIISLFKSMQGEFIHIWRLGSKDYIMTSVSYVLNSVGGDQQKVDEVVQIMSTIDEDLGGETMTMAEFLQNKGMQQGKLSMARALIKEGFDIAAVARAAQINQQELLKEMAVVD